MADDIEFKPKICSIGLNTFCQLDGLSRHEYVYSLDRNLAYFEKIDDYTVRINKNLCNVEQISNKIINFYEILNDEQKRMLLNPENWQEEIQIGIKVDFNGIYFDRTVCDQIKVNSRKILQLVKKHINITTIQYFLDNLYYYQ
jgi:hypothetical protein